MRGEGRFSGRGREGGRGVGEKEDLAEGRVERWKGGREGVRDDG